ncbi:hypothetical protein ACFOX0_09420 [Micromonospora zhanjiangensis]|uniref:Uncharacterized protein n=1 Tax=Micromonospora zhanjiangensis TaxID=1522057 RepID=A0ABV8KJE8_9ACTN
MDGLRPDVERCASDPSYPPSDRVAELHRKPAPLAASIRDIVATAPHRRPQGFVAFNNYV